MNRIKLLPIVMTVALSLGAIGCDDDDGGKPSVTVPDGGATTDGGTTTPTPDGGGDTTPTPMQFTLLEWVDGLVTNYTTPTADPDTVEDKNIKDTDDATAFDGLLGRQ
jgi:hypothetical protein